jgi:tetratricopeptide (TPR) repeat protein
MTVDGKAKASRTLEDGLSRRQPLDRAIDVRQIGRELGVRYVMEGSVRKAGQRLRITGQLVEAETGAHLWADRFDSSLEDVFDLQDRVTMAVAGAIEPSIKQAEIRRANRKPTANLRAYDWLLRALGEQQLYSREAVDRAMQMARRAIELDARYAQAHAYLASWTSRRMIYGWMEDEAGETAEGVRFAHLAVQLEPNDSIVLTEAAFGLGHLNRDLAAAIPWFDRAIALNPNSAMAFGRGAIVRNFAGDYITAAEHADRAMRLSPFDSYSFAFSLARGMSHLFSTATAGSGRMAAQGSAAEPAAHLYIRFSRQRTGPCRTDGRSPSSDRAPARTEPDDHHEVAAPASLLP